MSESVRIRWIGVVRSETVILMPIAVGALASLFWRPSLGAMTFGVLGVAYSLRALSVGISVDPDGWFRIHGFMRKTEIHCSHVREIRDVSVGPSMGVGLKARMLVLEIDGDQGVDVMDVPTVVCQPRQMRQIVRRLQEAMGNLQICSDTSDPECNGW